MRKEQPIIYNYGILTSISWNSNNWADEPTSADLKKSKYDYVKDNAHMHESLNFGHETLPAEEDGYILVTRQCSIVRQHLKIPKMSASYF